VLTTSTPRSSSARITARTTPRLTPRCSTRSTSRGSISPGRQHLARRELARHDPAEQPSHLLAVQPSHDGIGALCHVLRGPAIFGARKVQGAQNRHYAVPLSHRATIPSTRSERSCSLVLCAKTSTPGQPALTLASVVLTSSLLRELVTDDRGIAPD
jgi:hypothetical protein